MIFNSITFLVFFGIFFILYWFVAKKNVTFQNLLLLTGSYLFYAWADWRFLAFLVGISLLIFYLGIFIEKTINPRHRRWLLYIGLIQGIGGLLFFKYFNFFITSFNDAFQSLHFNFNLQTLNIIIPLGISFYTFKTISYILDVDKGKIEATKDWVVFFNFVSFFPTVLSGPIDKGRSFIPQLQKKRVFDYLQATDGLRQILWGVFKKLIIADNLAMITNPIFENHSQLPSSSLVLGAFFYTIQIYADFSGYSDMAIGLSRLIGFNVIQNFNFPLFAQNIAEFWRKWHISLTSWLTEYVFTPLTISFRDYGKAGIILAIVINFTICGIWHGANWTFVLFGFLHGCLFIPLIIRGTMNKKKKTSKNMLLPTFSEFLNILGTFSLVMFSFIIFRAKTISDAFLYYQGIFSRSSFPITEFEKKVLSGESFVTIFLLLFLMIMEWRGRNDQFAIEHFGNKYPRIIRFLFYAFILFLIGMFAPTKETPFIYIKF
jgi:alginate O-acetyltransferase complex protein AlgI